jgi:hypothetical protein
MSHTQYCREKTSGLQAKMWNPAPGYEPAQPVDNNSQTEDVDPARGGKEGCLREEGEVKEP